MGANKIFALIFFLHIVLGIYTYSYLSYRVSKRSGSLEKSGFPNPFFHIEKMVVDFFFLFLFSPPFFSLFWIKKVRKQLEKGEGKSGKFFCLNQ